MGLFIGLDPGVNGGMACIGKTGAVIDVQPLKNLEPLDIWEWIANQGSVTAVAYEGTHSSPKMGVVGAFTFGRGSGWLEMVATIIADMNTVTPIRVSPQKWQKLIGCTCRGRELTTSGKKNVTKAAAQKIFPNQKLTHSIADALLIAEYARRVTLKVK